MLVGMDRSPAARVAAHLATRWIHDSGRIVLLHVVDSAQAVDDFAAGLGLEGKAYLTEVAAELASTKGDSLWIESIVRQGRVLDELHSVCEQERADMVALGVQAHTPFTEVAESFAFESPCPTLLTRPLGPEPLDLERILVATDGATSSPLLRVGAALAQASGLRLEVVHALAPYETEPKTASRRREQVARQALEAGIDVPLVHLIEGRPAEALAEYVSSHDLVVCGTRARGAIGRPAYGGVASSLIRTAPCPMVLVRPDARIPSGRITLPTIQ
jgi:nucleotide-binding universal stress UspA family protein